MYRIVYSNCDDYRNLNKLNIVFEETLEEKNDYLILKTLFFLHVIYAYVFKDNEYYSYFDCSTIFTNIDDKYKNSN